LTTVGKPLDIVCSVLVNCRRSLAAPLPSFFRRTPLGRHAPLSPLGALALIASLGGFAAVGFAAAPPPLTLSLHSGPIRGFSDDGVRTFLGIPYAAPPVGKLRWQPPREVAPWRNVRPTTRFGNSCPQPKRRNDPAYKEDCLYLNVWSPVGTAGEKLPVMVWIHGGAFNFGSSAQPEYHGRNLAKKGVVVVTLNYRLGPLGFMAHPLLDKESGDHVSGNYGLLDQIAALKWVQKNIAAFSGDAALVTVFGQSAGSRSVSLLMISPLARGLFHRAISVSGGPIIGSQYLNPVFNGNKAGVSRMGERMAVLLKCDGAQDVLAAMRAKPADEIVAAANCNTGLFDKNSIFFAPVFDGRVLPSNPWVAYMNGQQHDVPMIVGSTLDEGNLYLANERALTLKRYRAFLQPRFGRRTERTFAMFPAKADSDVRAAVNHFVTVAANAQPARFLARAEEKKGQRSFLFQFTRRPGTSMAKNLGVHHGVDLAYVFGNMTRAQGYNDIDFRLSEQIMSYWASFARTGDPNGPGLTDWPVYRKATDINLELGDKVTTNRGLFKKQSDFLDQWSIYQE
jgi:para-nitrobenzyl esterase